MSNAPTPPPPPLVQAALVRLLGAALGLALTCQVLTGLTAAPASTESAANAAFTFTVPVSAGRFAISIQP